MSGVEVSPQEAELRVFDWHRPVYTALDDQGAYEIRAARASYRKRQGGAGWITYHDLADLVLREVAFSLDLGNAFQFSDVARTISNLLPAAARDQNPFEADEPSKQRDRDSDLPLLSRIRAEDLRISLRAADHYVNISAAEARYDVFNETLFLDGTVEIRTSTGDELLAGSAVLSARHNGLFLPQGGERAGWQDSRSFFAVLDRRGRLSTTPGQRPVGYEDMIEARERVVISRFADRAPPALRPLVTAILAAMKAKQELRSQSKSGSDPSRPSFGLGPTGVEPSPVDPVPSDR